MVRKIVVNYGRIEVTIELNLKQNNKAFKNTATEYYINTILGLQFHQR